MCASVATAAVWHDDETRESWSPRRNAFLAGIAPGMQAGEVLVARCRKWSLESEAIPEIGAEEAKRASGRRVTVLKLAPS